MNIDPIPSIAVVKQIIEANQEAEIIQIVEYPTHKDLQDRISLNGQETQYIANALDLRERFKVPFWDSLLLEFMAQKKHSQKILEEARYHALANNIKKFPVKNFNAIEDYLELHRDKYLAISSRVECKGNKIMHIPLLDFRCPVDNYYLELVTDILININICPGYILVSGNSYQFYGLKLISQSELVNFLAIALHYSPVVDKSFIAHHLRDLYCSLRLTKKNNLVPYAVKKI